MRPSVTLIPTSVVRGLSAEDGDNMAEATHRVEFVDEGALPRQRQWAFVEQWSGGVVLLLDRSAVTPEVLTEAWTAYRRMLNNSLPQQRRGLITRRSDAVSEDRPA